MSTATATVLRGATRRLPRAHPQLTTAAAQLIAGAGNLLYALLVARLVSSGYGQVAAFLGAYLLVHVPLASATAAAAVRPQRLASMRRTLLLGGIAVGAVLAALAPFAPAIGWDPATALVLAAALPGAGLLAIERGRLLAARDDARFAATLLVEPAVRLACGVAATVALGPVGAAAGVVAGGYAALALAAMAAAPTPRAAERAPASGRVVAGTFTALAVVQTQDVVLAGAVLASGAAADFGALSTLGGIAAFATTTIPLVLLPRAVAGERGALRSAVLIAIALGAAAFLPALVAPQLLMTILAGDRYAGAADLAAPYLGAMALLGIARVLLAHRAAVRPGPGLIAVLGAAAAIQTVLVLAADTPGDVVRATLTAATVLAAGAVLLEARALLAPSRALPGPPAAPPAAAPTAAPPAAREWRPVALLMLAALAIRLVCSRSLWLDEATSVSQAQMPFGTMLDALRSGDVHPPLHDAILWVLAHGFGTGATVMRAPSLLAGTALVGVVYLAGRELWDHRAGLAAAALATVAPFAIWYSQEARMYELFMLFAALAIYGQARVLRRGDARGWLCWTAATVLLVWTHYFAVLPIAAQLLVFAATLRGRGQWLRLLGALALVALACAPLALFAHSQYAANEASGRGFNQTPSQTGEAGHEIPGPYAILTNLVWALWGYHSAGVMARVAALWPLLMLLALGLLGRGRDHGVRLLWTVVLIPVAGLVALGHAKPFLFEARYFAGAVPALLLLLGHGAARWSGGRRVAVAAVTVAIAGSFGVATADQQLSHTNPRLYDFRGALTRVETLARPGDVVVYTPAFLGDLVRYYAPQLHARALPEDAPPPRVRPGRRVFLLASFQEEPEHAARTDRALADLARRQRFERVIRRPQVEVWVYR